MLRFSIPFLISAPHADATFHPNTALDANATESTMTIRTRPANGVTQANGGALANDGVLATATALRTLRKMMAVAALLLLVLSGCGPAAGDGVLVVRVTSGLQFGEIDRLEVEWTVAGKVVSANSFELGISAGKLQFPAEFRLTDVADGVAIQVAVTGYDGDTKIIERSMQTSGVAGQELLYPMHLDGQCAQYPPTSSMQSGPLCDAPGETCIAGKCNSSAVAASSLLPYGPPKSSDVCKPADAGPPEVQVGQGQADYLSMTDYELAQIEAGPQGGHHIWVAVRLKNLTQSGSITTVRGEIPALNLTISPLKVIFTMEPDEGGYCKLYGLRFQIDIDGGDIETFLGQELKVIVTVDGGDGATGMGERWVTLSDTII